VDGFGFERRKMELKIGGGNGYSNEDEDEDEDDEKGGRERDVVFRYLVSMERSRFISPWLPRRADSACRSFEL
jgi:hypothetical protein